MRKWRTAVGAISFALLLAGSLVASGLTGSAQGTTGNRTVGGDQRLAAIPINSSLAGSAANSSASSAVTVTPVTLAGSGTGPGNVAGSGTTLLLVLILILLGGLLLARDAFRP